MALTQAARQIGIDTPLGEDALLLRSFHGQEAISKLFAFELDLVSEEPSIKYADIVGQAVTVRITLADGSLRYWNGFVNRFVQAGRDSNVAVYQATIVPWLWFLDQTTDCRIFQNKTAPDIIKQIFQEYGFHDFSLSLYGDFVTRDYCVQYRESDFNFVSRLMEEEGIFYFFQHDDGKHTLILGNDPAVPKPCPNQATARYEGTSGGWQDDDVILQWLQEQEFRPGVFTATDYNFETPSANLLSSVNGKGKWEIYDFPGEYTKRADGDKLVKVRLQEQQMPECVARGTSDCRAFEVGYKFKLTDHYRDDLNQEYVLTKLQLSARHNLGYASGSEDTSPVYENNFECVPAATPIRPARRTPVPVVQGVQTAVVVGPSGEEIFTDKYGRVKVQFHWDREGKKNENSSCWVRVSYPWAGKAWGGIHIPRIGQEVVVDFIEGDPDRPIITGRVYNAGQMPPWDLPGKMMVSGYKSNSTKGGGGYNEISFDDTKGTELIQVHGQYDMDTKIEHDERRHVLNNRSKNVDVDETSTIGNNRTEKVGKNEQIRIGVNRTETVGSNENITIGSNRTENVGANESITVALTRTRNVGINEMVNVGGAQEITIGGLQALTVGLTRAKTIGVSESVNIGTTQSINVGTAQTVNVGAKQSISVGASRTMNVANDLNESIGANQTVKVASNLTEDVGSDQKTTVGGKLTESVGSDHSNSVGGKRETKVSSDDTLDVGSNLTIKAGSQITLETGSSKIVMKSGGQIEISGMSITIKGSTSIKEEAVSINIEASGINTIKGSLVKIN
ncbi:MAG: type VI secretion system tip protein VgrG [Acidobacteriia bacterium]|nr:type VI secretion system tip protein VgrG [Terriglobia bacterium]